ncbi:MAG: serine/threonine-protein kinase [Pseudomonadota bacterium]
MGNTSEQWQRVRELFGKALSQPVAEQHTYVRRADVNDDIKQEVFALLGAAEATGQSFEAIIAKAAADAGRAGDIDTLVDNYRIKRLIGEGGMGEVYLAERADEQYQQNVALKLLSGRMPTQELVARFVAERQMLASLEHPNIARLLDGGETSTGTPYLVMDYIDGVAIDAYCEQNDLAVRARVELFIDVCHAVEYAHRSLIVHRDVKPSNVLVTQDGTAKLLDFGIAKFLQENEDASLTRSSARVLSPMHASPEQVRGESVTVATDVYSLGVMLYQLLSGFHPYGDKGTTAAEVEHAICETDPVRPSVKSGNRKDYRTELSGDLDNIVLKAMSKEAARRYGSVRELIEDLQRYLAHRPVLARPSTLSYRMGKFLKRNRVSTAIAASALVVIATGSVISVKQITNERDIARESQRSAEAISEFLTNIFVSADPGNAKGEEVTAVALLDYGKQQIENDLSDDPATQLVMHRVLADTYYSLERWDDSNEQLVAALAVAASMQDADISEIATVKLLQGFIAQDRSDFDLAQSLFAESRSLRQKYHDAPHFDLAEVIAAEAHLFDQLGAHDDALRLYQESLDIIKKLGPDQQHIAGETMTKMAGVLRKEGKHDDAKPLLDEALVLLTAVHGDLHPSITNTKRHLAGFYRDARQYEKSKALYEEVIAERKTLLGPDAIAVGNALNSYSQLLGSMDDLDGAVEASEAFMRILDIHHDDPNASYGAAYNNHAILQSSAGQHEAALVSFRKSIEQQDAIGLAPDHFHRSFPLYGMANTYRDMGDYETAEAFYRRALPMREAAFDTTHLFVNQVRNGLGSVLIESGELEEAESLLQEALTHLQEHSGNDHPETKVAVAELERIAALRKME